MITVGRGRRILKLAGAATAAVTVLAVAGCAAGDSGTDGGDGGDVTIEFAQWWEPELPDGEFERSSTSSKTRTPASRSSS